MDLDEALRRIDVAAEQAGKRQGVDETTLEAMRFLWRHSAKPDFRQALLWFKDSLETEYYIGRSQNANASRNRIRWLLGRAC